jgi:hypothetical protein
LRPDWRFDLTASDTELARPTTGGEDAPGSAWRVVVALVRASGGPN